ncbi:hypothetical protein T439DRAFT_349633 [Meredithblackwellia eburnea MCA 4105]
MAPQPYQAAQHSGNYDLPSWSDDEDDSASNNSSDTQSKDNSFSDTILGFADGPIPLAKNGEEDWQTSRIGGFPTFPPLLSPIAPAPKDVTCLSCHSFIPLITQIYCPLPNSCYDRVVYTFACPRRSCRGKPGFVRAFRASSLWTGDDEEEEVTNELESLKVTDTPATGPVRLGDLIFGSASSGPSPSANPFAPQPAAGNPFAPSISTANPFATPSNSFAAGVNPFAPAPFLASSAISPPQATSAQNSSSSLRSTTSAPKEIKTRSSTPSPSTSTWPAEAPSFPAQYLTTAYEPAEAAGKKGKNKSMTLPLPSSAIERMMDMDENHREGKGSGGRVKKGATSASGKGKEKATGSSSGDGWAGEGYEVQKVKGVDDVFLQFQVRVSAEGSQCVRYNHSSTPIPFSSSSPTYSQLFPLSSSGLGTYEPSRVPSCSHCGGPSVFEYQLMPAIVSILSKLSYSQSKESSVKSPENEKHKEGSRVGAAPPDEDGVEFATVLVFTCLQECVGEKDTTWREELVFIEMEVD